MSELTNFITSPVTGFFGGLAKDALNYGFGISNYGLQKDTLEWQKKAQQQAWMREDNAVQRRVADLKAAGINPLMAAGQAATSSQPIQLHAPGEAPQMQMSAFEKAGQAMQLQEAQAGIDHTRAQTMLNQIQAKKYAADIDHVNAQTAAITQQTTHEAEMQPLRLEHLQSDINRIIADVNYRNASTDQARQQIVNLITEELRIRSQTDLNRAELDRIRAQVENYLSGARLNDLRTTREGYDLDWFRSRGLPTDGAQSWLGKILQDLSAPLSPNRAPPIMPPAIDPNFNGPRLDIRRLEQFDNNPLTNPRLRS